MEPLIEVYNARFVTLLSISPGWPISLNQCLSLFTLALKSLLLEHILCRPACKRLTFSCDWHGMNQNEGTDVYLSTYNIGLQNIHTDET